MEDRLHNFMYGVLYPAFLGFFFVDLFFQSSIKGINFWWGVLLSVYFMLQQTEGMAAKVGYGIDRFFKDVAEIGLMILSFALLGMKPGGPETESWAAGENLQAVVISLTFLAPAFFRVSEYESVTKGDDSFYSCLTHMSFAAFFLVLVFGIRFYTLIAVAFILATYAVGFSLFNERMAGVVGIPKRPEG